MGAAEDPRRDLAGDEGRPRQGGVAGDEGRLRRDGAPAPATVPGGAGPAGSGARSPHVEAIVRAVAIAGAVDAGDTSSGSIGAENINAGNIDAGPGIVRSARTAAAASGTDARGINASGSIDVRTFNIGSIDNISGACSASDQVAPARRARKTSRTHFTSQLSGR